MNFIQKIITMCVFLFPAINASENERPLKQMDIQIFHFCTVCHPFNNLDFDNPKADLVVFPTLAELQDHMKKHEQEKIKMERKSKNTFNKTQ